MALKMLLANQLRSRQSPLREDPEEVDSIDGGILPLNYQGGVSPIFDSIVGPLPSGKDKSSTSLSGAILFATYVVAIHDNLILDK